MNTEPLDVAPCTALWLRRLSDGRCLVLGVLKKCPLPDGIDDAVVGTQLMLFDYRDATANGRGKSWIQILEEGWSGLKLETLENRSSD